MSYYQPDFGNHVRHAFVVAGILLLHFVAIRALWSGLATSRVRDVATIFQIDMLPAEKPKELPPRPSPVNLMASQAIQEVAPQIDIPVAEDPPSPIQVTAVREERDASPGPPASPSAPAAPSVPNVRPRPIYVPGGRERYPAESIRAGESGEPTIMICISASGAVDSVQVHESSGFPRLDQAAVGIGKEARFRPAKLDGKPVPTCVPYRIKFAMNNL
jgi:periplasmic protein TonB